MSDLANHEAGNRADAGAHESCNTGRLGPGETDEVAGIAPAGSRAKNGASASSDRCSDQSAFGRRCAAILEILRISVRSTFSILLSRIMVKPESDALLNSPFIVLPLFNSTISF